MTEKKVSIITPFFNASQYLEDIATSIKEQTYSNWEWIIVNDTSQASEWEQVVRLAETDSRISAINRSPEKNKGACACRNTGMDRSSGDYLLFLDADDLISSTCLENRLRSSEDFDTDGHQILYFQTVAFEEKGPSKYFWDDPENQVEWLESIWIECPPCQSSGPFWPSRLIKGIRGWNENMAIWQDLEIHTRAHVSGIRFINAKPEKPDVYYRISPKSLSHLNIHSFEKTTSKLQFLSYCLDLDVELSGNQIMALRSLTYRVLKGLIAQRRWREAWHIANQKSARFDTKTRCALKRLILAYQLRLHKFPLFSSQIDGLVSQLKSNSQRKILTRPYQES
jgi:glycosyltransferase involved in cell wall biosynthesis